MLNYIELYGDGFGRDVISADSPKIEGIERNGPLGVGKIRRNQAIASVKFFFYVIAGANGFERVAVLPIGSVREAAFHYSRFRIFLAYFSKFVAFSVRIPLFKRTAHTHTAKVGSSLDIEIETTPPSRFLWKCR